MRMNWLVLLLYPVGAIVVTMAEGDNRGAARQGSVAPSIEIGSAADAGDSARRLVAAVAAWDVPMHRTQAGVRNDDPEFLLPEVDAPRGAARPLVTGRTVPGRCDETIEPGSVDRCG